MTQAHVAQIAQLETLCFSDPWSVRSLASELDNPLSCWLVALEDDVVAGYVGSQTVMDESDMMNIAVHPDFRRRGIARMLVTELITRLRDRGSHQLTLEVRASNVSAKALYASAGFQAVGRRKNYYAHPREDADILQIRF